MRLPWPEPLEVQNTPSGHQKWSTNVNYMFPHPKSTKSIDTDYYNTYIQPQRYENSEMANLGARASWTGSKSSVLGTVAYH